jgi:hypothetical protein
MVEEQTEPGRQHLQQHPQEHRRGQAVQVSRPVRRLHGAGHRNDYLRLDDENDDQSQDSNISNNISEAKAAGVTVGLKHLEFSADSSL